MFKNLRIPIVSTALYALLTGTPVYSWEHQLGLEMGARYDTHSHFLERDATGLVGQLHFSSDRSRLRLSAEPYLALTSPDGAGGFLQAVIDWEDSDAEEAEEQVNAEVTNAYLSLSKGGLSVDLGLQTVALGNGLILADDILAAALSFKRGKGYLQLTLAQVLDNSPMAALTTGYRPGAFEHVALFGIWFRDQDDAFARAIPLIYQVLLQPQSEGELYWAGLSADLFVGKALISAVGAYQWGQFRLYNQTADIHRNVSAFLADLSVEGNLSDWCSLGAFVFVAGGDDTPLRNDLNAFVAITPFNPRALIFFDPEFLGRAEDAENLTFNGGFFGGVIAPGLTVNLVSESGLSLETTLASFYAHQALADGSQWYGWELDLGVSYALNRIYTLYAQAARFEHGDYYESLLNEKVETAMQFIVGLRANF